MIPLLSDGQGRVKLAAIETLTAIGPSARYAAEPAFELLLDKHASLCEAARQYFLRLSSSLADFVPPLIAHLNSSETARGRAALAAVQAIGPVAAAALPAIYQRIDDPALREAVADALGQLGPTARLVVPDLIERLMSRDVAVRRTAARAMVSLGPLVQQERPVLINQLSDRDPQVRELIAKALENTRG